jgi:hypothetical protein
MEAQAHPTEVTGSRRTDDGVEYYVIWNDGSESWEPVTALHHAKHIIDAYTNASHSPIRRKHHHHDEEPNLIDQHTETHTKITPFDHQSPNKTPQTNKIAVSPVTPGRTTRAAAKAAAAAAAAQSTEEPSAEAEPQPEVVEEEEPVKEWVVEKILDVKVIGKKIGRVKEYLVKWEGFGDSESTWEPEANLANVSDLIHEFELNRTQKAVKDTEEDVSANGVEHLGEPAFEVQKILRKRETAEVFI